MKRLLLIVVVMMMLFAVSVNVTEEPALPNSTDSEAIITEDFIDPDLVGTTLEEEGSIALLSGPMGESWTSKRLPTQYKTVYSIPKGQGSGRKGSSGAIISVLPLSGSSKAATFNFSYAGASYGGSFSYKIGKSSGTGAGCYNAAVPSASGAWRLELIKYYEIYPTKRDMYFRGVYQHSKMVYSTDFSTSHRWKRS